MLLRNYYNMLTAISLGFMNAQGISADILREKYYLRTTNNEHYSLDLSGGSYGNYRRYNLSLFLPDDTYAFRTSCSTLDGKTAYCLGSGDSDVTFDDYTTSPLLYDDGSPVPFNAITIVNPPTTRPAKVTWDGNSFVPDRRYIITNNSASKKIIIKEWGIVMNFYLSVNRAYNFLMFREKLNEPFIIEENESVFFDITGNCYPAKPN